MKKQLLGALLCSGIGLSCLSGCVPGTTTDNAAMQSALPMSQPDSEAQLNTVCTKAIMTSESVKEIIVTYNQIKDKDLAIEELNTSIKNLESVESILYGFRPAEVLEQKRDDIGNIITEMKAVIRDMQYMIEDEEELSILLQQYNSYIQQLKQIQHR